MKKIPLTKGLCAIVDDCDYGYLSQWKWCCNSSGYAVRSQNIGTFNGKQKTKQIYMHRLLCETHDKVDHINGNTLDNRRSNLRKCVNQENGRNRRKQFGKTSSRFKGVYFNKLAKKWRAHIKSGDGSVNLGYFREECDAALAYNFAALEYHGSFARYNEAI